MWSEALSRLGPGVVTGWYAVFCLLACSLFCVLARFATRIPEEHGGAARLQEKAQEARWAWSAFALGFLVCALAQSIAAIYHTAALFVPIEVAE